jgi:hypothetical protein
MNVDYLLIGYGRDGEVKHVEHENGDFLASVLEFEPANRDSIQYSKRIFTVKVIHHLGNRYAIAIALEDGEVITATKINTLIESSGMKPVPRGIIGEI